MLACMTSSTQNTRHCKQLCIGMFAAAVVTALVPAAGAQVSVSFENSGPNLLVAGHPFQAERVTRVSLFLPDGSREQHEEHELLSRDSQGRLLDESFETAAGAPSTHFFMLADPVSGREFTWSTQSDHGFEMPLRSGVHFQAAALREHADLHRFPWNKASTTSKDLGAKQVGGVDAIGTQTVMTVPAEVDGNAEPLMQTDVTWIAPTLSLVVAEKDKGSLTGERTVETISLIETEPPAARFTVPSAVTFRTFGGGFLTKPFAPTP